MPQVSSGARVDTKVDQQLLRETSKEEFLAHCRRETGGFFANLRSVPDAQRPKVSDQRAIAWLGLALHLVALLFSHQSALPQCPLAQRNSLHSRARTVQDPNN